MKTHVRKMGNSQGVLIPKSFLAKTGMELGEVDIAIERGAIIIRKRRSRPRQGWAEASRALAASGNDQPIWPEVANEADKDLVW